MRPRARLRAVRRPTRETIRTFQRRLLAWYRTHGRDLPWRRTRSAYRVLVSEIMLQQTQVERVLPKYREFLRRYPTIESLARARVGEVRKLWYPLGYNIRPVRLHMIARETVARYHGRLPDEAEALRALPGIGRYTAGAVLSFAAARRCTGISQKPSCLPAAPTTSIRLSWTSAPPGARRGARAACPAP